MTPAHYKEGLARVSDIIEFKFPFKGTISEGRFKQWLVENSIEYDDYMDSASSGGRTIHEMLEMYMIGADFENTEEYFDYYSQGKKALTELQIEPLKIEEHFISEDYQGTIDLIAKVGKEKNEEFILDWKTYNLSKRKYGKGGVYRKPTDKLKKARLQLSLYALATGIKNIAVIELTPTEYHFHKLKLIPENELKEIILDFKNKKLGNTLTGLELNLDSTNE